MLYNKMMLTAPDQSRRNVRVNARPNMDDLNRRHRRQLLDDYYSDFVEPDSNQPAAPEEEEEVPKEDEEGNPVVDRETARYPLIPTTAYRALLDVALMRCVECAFPGEETGQPYRSA